MSERRASTHTHPRLACCEQRVPLAACTSILSASQPSRADCKCTRQSCEPCLRAHTHAGQHLESKRREEWKDAYIDYKGLKDLIKACAHQAETGEASFSPRTTSLTIARYNNQIDSAEERFFTKLEGEVSVYACTG